MALLEIACFNLPSAIIAFNSGADRIELCKNYKLGGLTPNIELIKQVRQKISIPIHVIIRPRGGNFNYSTPEFESMKKCIHEIKNYDIQGFVFGILEDAGNVDIKRNTELVEMAFPFSSHFHRAFDRVNNVEKALNDIIDCGFKSVLSSGGSAYVIDGIDQLYNLFLLANGRIEIIPGGGIRSTNISQLLYKNIFTTYHSSAIVDGILTANSKEIKALKFKIEKHIFQSL